MLNKQDFKDMRNDYDEFDQKREKLIKDSRDLLKLSKQIIYAIHRHDMKPAETAVAKIKKALAALQSLVKGNPQLEAVGAYKVAVGEYAEALLYYHFIKDNQIPTRAQLKIDAESYLLGLCDLTGELVRKAVFLAGKGKYSDVMKIKECVDEIYGEIIQFNLRNSELRKKADSIKYDLKKLEDLVLQIKLKR
jgi:translin